MKSKLIFILMMVVSLSGIYAQDTRYDADKNLPFNEKSGDVNPQTGNLTLNYTDVSLPGRAGFNFTFSRVWNLNTSNAFNMYQDKNDGSNKLSGNTAEKHYRMGTGWSNNIPYVMVDKDSQDGILNLFHGGSVYQIDRTGVKTDNPIASNLLGYDLVDMRIFESQGISYQLADGGFDNTRLTDYINNYGLRESTLTERSKYCLIMKNNEKYWFDKDGQLLMNSDKTELNKLWYFYDTQNRLRIVVDSIGRVITFSYDANGNLSYIEWEVNVGEKETNGNRKWSGNKKRSVTYTYINGETFTDVTKLKSKVIDYKIPYLLETVTDPMGFKTKFEYKSGIAAFTYDKEKYIWDNVYLMITGILDKWDTDGKYKNKRVIEYEVPAKGLYTKWFYNGYMKFYKVTGEYFLDKSGDENKKYNETKYIYKDNGESGNINQYTTVIQRGKVSVTYTYLTGSEKKKDNVLASILTASEDGYLEQREFGYDGKRAKTSEVVYHNGKKVYDESYIYDDRGNLVNSKDRVGLEVQKSYDFKYSIPLTEVSKVTVDGVKVEYKKENVITSRGQIDREIIYVAGRAITVTKNIYDANGNVIKKIDAYNNSTFIEYDDEKNCYPVKIYQDVSIDAWSDTTGNYWTESPTTNKMARIRSWKVFNSDGDGMD